MVNLNELLKRLLEHNIQFVIVGGFAGVVHGASQVTQDLDICLLMSPEEIEKLRGALKDLNPLHRMNPSHKSSFMDVPKDLNKLNNIYLETDIGVLDVLSEIPNIGDFKRVKQGSVEIEIFGHNCSVMGLDDLIVVKSKINRAKDQALYQELLEIKKSKN